MACMAALTEESIELGRIRSELRLTLRQIAEKLGIDENRYKNYEYGRTRRIPLEVIHNARKLLTSATNIVRERVTSDYIVTVAVAAYRGVLAGNSFDEEAVYEREETPTEIPSAFVIGGIDRIDQFELLRVSGNSMAPRVVSGDRVIIAKDVTPRPNTMVFAECPEGKLYLKRLTIENGRFALSSYAADGVHVEDLHGWKLHGHAIAILGDPDFGARNIEWNEGRPLRV